MSQCKFKISYVFHGEYSFCQIPRPDKLSDRNFRSFNSDDKTTFKQTLQISLNASKFDTELLTAPKTLKDFIHQYQCKKEIFDLEDRHDITDTNLPNKISFQTACHRCFLFVTAIISLLVMTLAIYLLCKHKKFRMLVTSLALQ